MSYDSPDMKLPLASCALILVACGGGASRPATSTDTTAAKAEPAVAPSVEAAPATAKPETKTPAKDDKPAEPLKWADFPGPNAAPAKADVIWAIAPIQNATWKSSLALFRAEETKVDGNSAVIKGVKGDVFVPGAFTKMPLKKDYKKGQAVIVASMTGLYAGASFGRVTAVTKDAGQVSYKVKYMFGGSSSEADVEASAMLPLEDKLTMGAPAAYKEGDTWKTGIFAAPALDKKSYVMGWIGEVSPQAGVKPLVVTKVYKKGDKVWAASAGSLAPATITEVVDDGLAYKIKPKDGDEKTVDFTSVTSPL